MKLKLKKYWHLFWLFRKLALMQMMEYRTDFYFWSLVSLMWTAFNFFFYGLLVNLTGQIGGWSVWQMYLLVSVFAMLDSLTWSLMGQNMWHYTRSIFSGEMSAQLVKPVDFQFLHMTHKNSYNNFPRFFIGLCGIIFSLYKLQIVPSLLDVLLAVVALISSFLFIYLCWFTVANLAFWVERLDNINEVVPSLRSFWQLPRSVYGGLVSMLLTFVLPISLMTSLPSEALLGQSPWWLVGYLVLATGVIFYISRLVLKVSLKRYSSVGG